MAGRGGWDRHLRIRRLRRGRRRRRTAADRGRSGAPSRRDRGRPARRRTRPGACRRGESAAHRGPRGQPRRSRAVPGHRRRGDRSPAEVLPRRQHRDRHGGGPVNERTDGPLVLGIETSCDETGVGIVRGTTLLADAVASSVAEHERFGGVVPEVASRAHLEAMVPTIRRACDAAGIALGDVDAVAVTAGPGLAGALLVGVASAKALALSLDKPLYGVNHLAAHVAVDQLQHGPLPEPCLAMLVSGGHSSLLLVPDVTSDIRPLGSTVDDAAGEAFDKVARVLGLGFPGGPLIDRAAREGDGAAITFPRGLTGPNDAPFDFSFSGLKTAVARWVEARERAGEPVPIAD